MKNSNFQLEGQKLIYVNYKINDNFSPNKNGVELEFDYNIEVKKDLDSQKAVVDLFFKVFKEENLLKNPFYIDICIRGWFYWQDEIEEEILDTLLKINAPAVLMSYIRPVISQLTSFSGYPALILPLINFTIEND
jgi:preprotein translocase subunit SecB